MRNADAGDLDFILDLEANVLIAPYIVPWSRVEHAAALQESDKLYLIADAETGDREGFVILAGLESVNGAIELVRIAVRTPGGGQGKVILAKVIAYVFERLRAHRLWLDVFTDNERARHVYRTMGFVEEGVMRDAALIEGRFHSLVLMSILEEEFRTAAGANSWPDPG